MESAFSHRKHTRIVFEWWFRWPVSVRDRLTHGGWASHSDFLVVHPFCVCTHEFEGGLHGPCGCARLRHLHIDEHMRHDLMHLCRILDILTYFPHLSIRSLDFLCQLLLIPECLDIAMARSCFSMPTHTRLVSTVASSSKVGRLRLRHSCVKLNCWAKVYPYSQ